LATCHLPFLLGFVATLGMAVSKKKSGSDPICPSGNVLTAKEVSDPALGEFAHGRRIFEMNDQWPQGRLVIRVNWFRVVALAGLLTTNVTLVTIPVVLRFDCHRLAVRDGPPTQVPSSNPTLRLVAESACQGTDKSRSPPVPLGIFVRGQSELASTATVEIIGLPSRWVASVGWPLGNRWRIPAAQLPGAQVFPPEGFSGAVELTAELRLMDGTVVERRSLCLAMIDPKLANENDVLVRRAESYLDNHDTSSARLLLLRAAELGSAEARQRLDRLDQENRPPTMWRTSR
jgi:hypothetical protein